MRSGGPQDHRCDGSEIANAVSAAVLGQPEPGLCWTAGVAVLDGQLARADEPVVGDLGAAGRDDELPSRQR